MSACSCPTGSLSCPTLLLFPGGLPPVGISGHVRKRLRSATTTFERLQSPADAENTPSLCFMNEQTRVLSINVKINYLWAFPSHCRSFSWRHQPEFLCPAELGGVPKEKAIIVPRSPRFSPPDAISDTHREAFCFGREGQGLQLQQHRQGENSKSFVGSSPRFPHLPGSVAVRFPPTVSISGGSGRDASSPRCHSLPCHPSPPPWSSFFPQTSGAAAPFSKGDSPPLRIDKARLKIHGDSDLRHRCRLFWHSTTGPEEQGNNQAECSTT